MLPALGAIVFLMTIIAAVQGTPAFDRDGTIERIAHSTKDAAAHDAALVVYPEAFVPHYPDWVWRTTPWCELDRAWYDRFSAQCVDVPGSACDALAAIAAENSVYLVVPVNERDGGTIYNTILYFAPDGALLGKHRKLIPTGAERLVWGAGDGSTLTTIDTPFGRIGGLICWENYMPLARAALYEQRIDVLLSPTWDNSSVWVPSMQHIAREGRCYVVGVTACIRGSDVPDDAPGRDEIYGGADDFLSRGNSVIVDPTGHIVAPPVAGEVRTLYADIDLDVVRNARREFDVVGHYSRPDVFQLHVNRD
jgi:nitrilase